MIKHLHFALFVVATMVMTLACEKQYPASNQQGTVEQYVEYDGEGLSTSELVDMGGSVLWNSVNLGAATPLDYGEFYSWGETESKDVYLLKNYRYATEVRVKFKDGFFFSKYADSDYCSDALYTLIPEDDAATANLGEGYRMPSATEMKELLDSNKVTWVHYKDKPGVLVESKKTGNKLFFPAAGFRLDESHYPALYNTVSAHCYYLTGELLAKNREEGIADTNYYSDENLTQYRGDGQDAIVGGFSHASIFYARYDTIKMGIGNRSWGMPVRAVKVK